LISRHCEVTFKANPKRVLEELEANEYLECDANSDEVRYDGQKIVAWRQPSMNKGFGIGSFLLVIVIILMMVPNALKALGVYERERGEDFDLPKLCQSSDSTLTYFTFLSEGDLCKLLLEPSLVDLDLTLLVYWGFCF
jgi:hypothetical protein